MKILVSLCTVVLIFQSAYATSLEDQDVLTPYLEQEVQQGKIAGVHAMVCKDGEIIYSKRFGYSNTEAKTELPDNAIYRIASMTKVVTAIAALQLWEKGLYKLDDPVSFYLPYFRDVRVLKDPEDFEPPYETEAPRREPTIRDLLRHTSGIWGGHRYTIAGLRDWNGSLDEFVEQLVSVPLDNQPGSRFRYSYSLDVVGLLIEKWSGQNLDDYFEQNIFQPLGLEDTGFVIPEEKIDRLVSHYDYKDDQLICYESPENSPFRVRSKALSGGGGWNYSYPGLTTTIHDWLVIMETIRNYGIYNNARILKAPTVRLMCMDHLGNIPGALIKGTGYGFGVGVVIDEKLHGKGASDGTVFWAGGPHNTYFYIDFKKKLSGALFLQSGPFGIDDIMNGFLIRSQQMFGGESVQAEAD